MELYSYINPLSANLTKWSDTCKISFIFRVCEKLYLKNFQILFIRKNKYTRNTILLVVKINPLQN